MYENDNVGMMDQVGGFELDSNLSMDGVQKKLMPLFLLIDTSGSMSGPKIEQVKTAVEEIKLQLNMLNIGNPDSDVKISVLCFDDAPRWEAKMESPELINPDLQLGTMTMMGAAFVELEKMLSRSQLIQKGQCAGYKRAVMILLTDGMPSDDVDSGILKLKTNNWFVKGTRIAFAIGDQADETCLAKFTGNPENVLRVNNMNLLGTILANVAVVLSTTATHAAGISSDDATTQAQRDKEFGKSAEETTKLVEDAIEEQIVTGELDGDKVSKTDDGFIFEGWTDPSDPQN